MTKKRDEKPKKDDEIPAPEPKKDEKSADKPRNKPSKPEIKIQKTKESEKTPEIDKIEQKLSFIDGLFNSLGKKKGKK